MRVKTALFGLSNEAGVLRTSIAVTLLVSSLGIGFGVAAGSSSIAFDGVFSLIDAGVGLLSLVVVNLIASYATSEQLSRKLRERFTMGFWHLEPMVLAVKGTMLIGLTVYALVNSAGILLKGGRDLEFGLAIVYAIVTILTCAAIAAVEARANRTIGSDFVRLDVKSWIMSAGITAALLIAFCLGFAVQGTSWQWISPYIDPAVLAIVCLIIIPLPISDVRQAFSDILLLTPADLKRHVDNVAQAFVAKHAITSYRAYIAKVGRLRMIELYFIVPADIGPKAIAGWDALRDEIGETIGDEGPDRWLTVVFTGDPEWAE
jgi:predicted Co/Zn/Cd cation transporter (cation efflux family)